MDRESKKVLLICLGGMSSSLMAKNTNLFLKKQGYDITIDAVASTVDDRIFASDAYNLILISPQIRMKYDVFKRRAEKYGKKIVKVPIDSYAPIESSIANLTRLILENL